MKYQLSINSNIISGVNTLRGFLQNLTNNNLFLVDIHLYKNSSYIKKNLDKLIKNKNNIYFYDHAFEPSYELLDILFKKIKTEIKSKKFKQIIAIGGGSTMDTAKGLAILLTNKGKSINFRGFPENLNKPLDVVCVPSTVGTGSEVVYNASFIDNNTKTKLGINSKLNYPKLAILDPLVVSSMPFNVLASSACDALVHSLEGFVSKKASINSMFFSKKAFNLIMQNLPILLTKKGNIKNWSNMQWAAVYAIWGLSNSSSGPTGALSYYLGSNFNVSHGVAGACFIGKISRLNLKKGLYIYSELLDSHEKIKNNKLNATKVIVKIEKLLKLTKISQKLENYGVNNNNISGFISFTKKAKEAFELNPIKFTNKDIKFLLS